MSITYLLTTKLICTQTLSIEDITLDFPELKIVITAHLGHLWGDMQLF